MIPLPETAWFRYDGIRQDVRAYRRFGQTEIQGYDMVCPGCARTCSISRDRHNIVVAPNGALTCSPRVRCPHQHTERANPCTWSGWIELGEARLA